ncbi:Secreted thaumatin-like protein calA [Penicillium odoratum]|uniref:Secreted thaumatin-like protein calA n=1 Tax=Penicillium odoratum TaxID=1167516 RepID=UPI00254834A0|nr:Secreted thaumatin-like protein calA [Penicillium odoratum]KAJ5759459.1 Secreted thaumatin-like protein calA [Penicillium odoratum]
MRVIAALGLAALTGMVSAQPHGHGHHHNKRAVAVEIVTEIEWVTVHPEAAVAEATSTEAAVVATSTSEAVVQVAVQVPTSTSSVATVVPTSTVTPTWTTSSSVVASSTSDVIETATATGGSGVKIVNNLDQTVYLWTTSNVSEDMITIEEGDHYYENWQTNSDGGGISIKMSTSTDESSVLQFEYTKEDETIWWDMSSINLDKTSLFVTSGFSVTSNDASCSTVTCDAGDSDCSESYQQPDDVDTRSCVSTAAFILDLGL